MALFQRTYLQIKPTDVRRHLKRILSLCGPVWEVSDYLLLKMVLFHPPICPAAILPRLNLVTS